MKIVQVGANNKGGYVSWASLSYLKEQLRGMKPEMYCVYYEDDKENDMFFSVGIIFDVVILESAAKKLAMKFIDTLRPA
jgi:hypothetical protein